MLKATNIRTTTALIIPEPRKIIFIIFLSVSVAKLKIKQCFAHKCSYKKQKSPLETEVLMRTDKQVLQFHKKEKSVT
jgi:hypothetical protein